MLFWAIVFSANSMQFWVDAKPQHTFLLACRFYFYLYHFILCVILFQMTRWTGSCFQCASIRFYGLFCLWYAIVIQQRWKWNSPHTRTDNNNDDDDDDGNIVTTMMMMTPKMDRNVQKVTTQRLTMIRTKHRVCRCCYVSLLHSRFIWPK